MQIDFIKIFLFTMHNYCFKQNSTYKQNYRANHSTFPKWGKGDRRLTAVDEDVGKMLLMLSLFILSYNYFFIQYFSQLKADPLIS